MIKLIKIENNSPYGKCISHLEMYVNWAISTLHVVQYTHVYTCVHMCTHMCAMYIYSLLLQAGITPSGPSPSALPPEFDPPYHLSRCIPSTAAAKWLPHGSRSVRACRALQVWALYLQGPPSMGSVLGGPSKYGLCTCSALQVRAPYLQGPPSTGSVPAVPSK